MSRLAPPRRYAVFLSYRHADNKQEGRQWATWLHQALEGYEVPEELVGTPNSRGEPIPANLYPVFRDEEELPADADLTDSIRRALEHSDLLVVLCSPRAVESRFVADEIRRFKEMGKGSRILALMIDGEPNASDDPGKARSGIPAASECLPEPLRFGVAGADGRVDWTRRTEPIAADVRPDGRPGQGFTTGAAYREALQLAGKLSPPEIARVVRAYEDRLHLAKLKVIAGALGVPLGLLTERDKALQLRRARQRTRTLRRWLAAVGVLAILAGAGGVYAWTQRQEALERRRETQRAFSRADGAAALVRARGGQAPEAVAFLCRALRSDPENLDAAALLGSVLTTGTWCVPRERFEPEGEPLLAFSGDGRRALARRGEVLRVWDVEARRVLRELADVAPFPTPPRFTPDGRYLLATSAGSLRRIDVDTGAQTPESPPTPPPDGRRFTVPAPYRESQLRFGALSPDGRWLLAATMDETPNVHDTLRIWDAQTGTERVPAMAQGGDVTAATWSPDGSQVLTAAGDLVRIWDAATGTLAAPPLHAPDDVLDAWYSPDGRRILAAVIERAGVDFSQEPGLYDYALNPSGPVVSSFYSVRTLLAWDARVVPSGVATLDLPTWVLDAAYGPDGSTIAALTGTEARVWDAATRRWRTTIALDQVPVCLAFSPDGARLLTVTDDQVARVWNVADGTPASPPLQDETEVEYAREHDHRAVTSMGFPGPDHPSRQSYGAFRPDGRAVATAIAWRARVWDAATGRTLSSPPRHVDYLRSVGFSPDGRRLLTAGLDAEARQWDVAMGAPAGPSLHAHRRIDVAAYAPRGDRILTVSGGTTTQVWDARTGAIVCTVRQTDRVESAAFSPDGLRLVTGAGAAARVFDASTGAVVSAPMRHEGPLTSVTFSPDGRHVLTASQDRTARIWDATTGLPVSVPMSHAGTVNAASFRPDGRSVLTAGEDRRVKAWPFDPEPLPAWFLDFAEILAGCRLDATGAPSYRTGVAPPSLRERAAAEPAPASPLLTWARGLLDRPK